MLIRGLRMLGSLGTSNKPWLTTSGAFRKYVIS